MKKFFTLVVLSAMTIAAMATDYTDALIVNVNGTTSQQNATISVNKQTDGKYTLSINNFVFGNIGIGNIAMKDIEPTVINGDTILRTNQYVTVTPGNDPSITTWLGPTLGSVPVDMISAIKSSSLRAVINIDMQQLLGQTINVQFGSGYQLLNSDFENFHTVSGKSVEPNAWHSFGTASGSLAPATTNSTFKSNIVREGATGSSSVMLRSTSIYGIIANGTMTTGRLNAGSMFATNADNHSALDFSWTEKDGNGDPFYSFMNGKPDSLDIYVKFKQGTPQSVYKYATISAAITDGTYYQDPNDKTYTNVLASAKNNTIESKDFAWQKLSIPFDYATYKSNNAAGKAILVTISTNATPGKGSIDTLYVDDISMVYNAQLKSLKFKGADVSGFNKNRILYDIDCNDDVIADDITAEADGEGAYVIKDMTTDGSTTKAVISVYSNDLNKVSKYNLIFNSSKLGITNIGNTTNATVKKIYNVAGQQLSAPSRGINIIRYSDGKTVKVMNK
jgi:hypothetical protein